MIFKRKRHPLPKFPDTIIPLYMRLCETLDDQKFSQFAEEAHQAINALEDGETSKEHKHKRMLAELIDAVRVLLDEYPNRDSNDKALIVGAVRYFVIEQDPVPDTGFRSGLVDDAKVMNFVFEELGMLDHVIEI